MIEIAPAGKPAWIGHRGAAALAAENTLASLAAAVAAGVDVVEIDVLHLEGRLVLAHSLRELPAEQVSFDDALAYLRGTSCGVHVDVKADGIEADVVAALQAAGMEERALVSTTKADALRCFASLAPTLPRALTYPEDRLGLTRTPLSAPLVRVGLAAARRALPFRLGGLLGSARATIASLNHGVVSRAAVERCHALGVPVIAWTVDDEARIRELAGLGVDAVVSDDPRLLAATLAR